MKQRVVEYFTHQRPIPNLNLQLKGMVTNEMNAYLRHFPSIEEIHATIFNLGKGKALGLNGH